MATLGAAEAVALGACCSARAGWHATTTIESPSQRRTPLLCHGARIDARSSPSQTDGRGTPIGVQLAAAQGKDQLLLEVAAAIEAATPWPQQAPSALWS